MPKCPICGAEMRQTRRGASLAKRGPAYICPINEAETYRDERNHIKRKPGAKHLLLRVWMPDEL